MCFSKSLTRFFLITRLFSIGFLGLCALWSSVWAKTIEINSYPYPYENPFAATFTSIWVSSQNLHFQEGELTLHPERSKLKLVGQRNRLKYSYSLQADSSAPLIFIFSGLGGSSLSGSALFLAEQAYQEGYSVVTLPSSTHWSFALAASESGRVGYLPQDAVDQLRVLSFVRQKLQNSYSIRPSSFALLGFSYGALDSAFVAAEDLKRGEFQFKKIVLINPPLDRAYAARQLDSYYTQGMKWSEGQRKALLSLVVGQITTATPLFVHQIFTGEDSHWLPSVENSKLAWLMADQFRNSLKDVVFVSQAIFDDRVLRTQADEFHQNARLHEAKGLSFDQYLDSIVFTFWNKSLRKDHLEKDYLLMKAVDEVVSKGKGDQRFFLFHNQDDFLSDFSNSSQIRELEKFPGTVTLYPLGGHIGNLWFSKNIKDFRAALRFKNSSNF